VISAKLNEVVVVQPGEFKSGNHVVEYVGCHTLVDDFGGDAVRSSTACPRWASAESVVSSTVRSCWQEERAVSGAWAIRRSRRVAARSPV
jgi:hypothetical protein